MFDIEYVQNKPPENHDNWVYHAACRELPSYQESDGQEVSKDDFYPPVRFLDRGESRESYDERRAREARAKQVCGSCAVRPQCLEYALMVERGETQKAAEFINVGIWGGYTKKERDKLQRNDLRKTG